MVWRKQTSSFDQSALPQEVREAKKEGNELPALVLSACNCCLDLLNNLNEYSPVPGVVLRLHMGIGAVRVSVACGAGSVLYK